jgi:hypothetical protein
MFRRSERLQSSFKQTESDLSPQELKRLEQFSKQGYLVGKRSVLAVGDTTDGNPNRVA